MPSKFGSGTKAKVNPKKICFSCGTRIKNRSKNASYCKKCSRDINKIRMVLLQHKSSLQKAYNVKIKLRMEITKNDA